MKDCPPRLLCRAIVAPLLTLLVSRGYAAVAAAQPTTTVTATTSSQRYEVSWEATLREGAKNYSVLLRPGMPTTKTSPLPPGELRILFDLDDPPTENPFNAERNIDKRPEREIALFWKGMEIARRFCPTPLAGASGHAARLTWAFVTGGAELTLRVGDATIYDRYLVPDVAPFAAQFTFDGPATIRAPTFHGADAAPRNPPAIRVRALDSVRIANGRPGDTGWADFPRNAARIGRVVCTLTLAKTAAGVDPWDRIGNVNVYDEKGERFELLRFITPYRRAYQWQQDVTDLLPLLQGKRRVQIDCTTYGVGWLASVDFAFYPGPSPSGRHPVKVVNLWNTTALIGQADKPFAGFVPPLTLPIPADADAASVRLLVTGHGEDPNTGNAAEFISLWRRLTVGASSYQNTLWKDDNYLNTLRPQGGTWKYDRAGWGPGTVVEPWTVDVTKDVHPGQTATFDYTIQPYENKTPNAGDPARHIIGSQLILYRRG